MGVLKTTEHTMTLRFDNPKPSKWQCRMFGTNMVFRPNEGHVPNWFWRWMQFVCFGNKWTRDP